MIGFQRNEVDVISHNLPANSVLTRHVFRSCNPSMGKKPLTVVEMASMGGLARAEAHSKAQLRKWGKEGGPPMSLDRKALARLEALLHRGKSQAECAKVLGVSVRTIGRVVARIRASDDHC
jgi:hypothetical protein